MIFILLQREDLRNRFIKLAGSHDLQKTTAALDDAATRLSRLFLIQLALNTAFGIVIGAGLWIIGIPSPVLWGILAAVLRFVPYIGAVISAVFPLTLAAAVDPGWSMLLWTAALFLVVEPVVGHVIEPLLYGHSTGLSPVAVVASATFWTALWGPVGLVLATPLTICLVVLGRHVERFEFLDVMFGDRPALSPPELFYQRMLAEDPAEAVDKAEEFLKERPLSIYYDEVALPGLKLAQNDIARGALDRAQSEKIKDGRRRGRRRSGRSGRSNAGERNHARRRGRGSARNRRRCDRRSPRPQEESSLRPDGKPIRPCSASRAAVRSTKPSPSCLRSCSKSTGLARGSKARTQSRSPTFFVWKRSGIVMVCLSYLDASSPAHMRYTIRRMRRKLPKAKILLGCWMADVDATTLRETAKADEVATTLRDAVRLCLEAAGACTPSSLSAEVPHPAVKAGA